jgi:hypothetical protein
VSTSKITQPQPPPEPSQANGTTISSTGDEFNGLNPETFRLSQDYGALAIKRTAVTILVQKPDQQQWVQFHPDKAWRVCVGVLDDRENRRVFIVSPEIAGEIAIDLKPKLLVAYISRTGSMGLWPIRTPDTRGRSDSYNESATILVDQYAGQWVRIITNNENRCYEVMPLRNDVNLPPPQWPEEGFRYIFERAFQNRIIRSLNHEFLRMLRGEI